METGHNSGISAERLRNFVKRIEKLNEDKQSVAEDLKEVFSECKSAGFDTNIVRKIIAIRKKDIEKVREEHELLDVYMVALQMEFF
jgi:uncharacterized protein (UPF0335 family)